MYLFCNKCHGKIKVPEMFTGGNVNAAKGVKIACPAPGCTGRATYKTKMKTEPEPATHS